MIEEIISDNLYVGQIVNYHSVIGEGITSSGHKIKSIERRHGEWIAFITGKSGYVLTEALSVE